jgi:fatty acid desaturase
MKKGENMGITQEEKTILHLARIRKLLKVLAWIFLILGILWGIIYLSNIPVPSPSFFAITIALLDSILPNLMAFAILYALSEIAKFLGFIWMRCEAIRQKVGGDERIFTD